MLPYSLALPFFTGLFAASAWAGQVQVPPPAGGQAAPVAIRFDYYSIWVEDWQASLEVDLTQQLGNDADLYLRFGSKPDLHNWDMAAATPGTSNESLVVGPRTDPSLRSGRWWIGVRHSTGTSYGIDYRTREKASIRGGMGASPYLDGVTGESGTAFRVWAPNASKVWLAGLFNGWSATRSPMVSEGNGHWSLDVRNLGHGAHYQYVLRNGSTLWRNDPRAEEMTNSVGDSVVVDASRFDWGGQSWSTPSWDDMVLYEMHVGTFNDNNGSGPGTLWHALQKLDDLADLGINVIELMPVAEFPGDRSWGYNYSQPFAVESAYGGPAALREFVKQAHLRGIAVILDVVNNHWGPNDLDMWRFDGWAQGPWGGVYFYNDDRAVTPWGDTRPDYGRGEVRQYIRDNAMFWLQEYRLDGLRWDSTSFMRNGNSGDIPEAWTLLQWVNNEIDWFQGWKISIAEDMWNNPWITQDSGAGGAGFDSQWDAEFVHPLRAALIAPNDSDRDMYAVRDAIAHNYNGDAFQRVIYTESHDENANGGARVPEEIWPGNADSWYSKKRSTLGAALMLTSPGIPMLFQGQEFLEDGYFDDDQPLDWGRRVTFSGIRAMYRDLIRLRRNWSNSTRGLRGHGTNVHHVNNGDKMIAFHRWDQGGPGDDVVVVANFADRGWSNYRIGLPQAGTWRLRFNSDWSGYDAFFGNFASTDVQATATPWDGMPYSAVIPVGPYTALVYSQD